MLVMGMLISTTFQAYASAPCVSGFSRTDHMREEQFEQILETLRDMKDNVEEGDYYFRNTGVRCASKKEAGEVIRCFEELFLADDEFILYYNEKGYGSIYVEANKNHKGGYTYWLCGEGGSVRGIYAVWKPHADAEELLRQHDEASLVVDALLQQAPQSVMERIKYFNDILAERITYDMDGYQAGHAKHSPYYGLVEGTCVCTGYAEAFFALCYHCEIPCASAGYASIYSADGTPDHKTSMVNLDGWWSEVDVTWNDTDPGVRYTYFMRDLNEGWQEILGPWEH